MNETQVSWRFGYEQVAKRITNIRLTFYKEELKVHSGKRKGKVHGTKKSCGKMKK